MYPVGIVSIFVCESVVHVRVCVCVWEREREREREADHLAHFDASILHSKTIVHPAESRPSHPTQETADALSKENIQPMDSPARKKAKRSVSSKCHPSPVSAIPLRTAVMGSGKKEGGSRQQSSSLGKLPPKEGKKCRRRLLPPIKGQKSITSFFRV